MHTIFWLDNLKGRVHLDNLGVDGRIILEWILGKQGGRVLATEVLYSVILSTYSFYVTFIKLIFFSPNRFKFILVALIVHINYVKS
jgi:hypothetical protein